MSLTDRELLELAAKAVGLDTNHKWNAQRMDMNPPVISLVAHRGGELVSTAWNPLRRDADALRLAVDLSLQVKPSETGVDVCDEFGHEIWCAYTEANSCHYEMTRRAITCAAAEIGKAMQEKH
ncbi:hypothetical protein [Pseudomonas putida]|jgi:hypothetical protein|uniref:hypothetical protein n=1 Tax=Pseudomonas putida TaxID=303 RepID=UPI000465C177|nr:hypothetical protein [Pseudomonas putida]